MVLSIVAMSAIGGILNRSVITVADASMAIYLFGTIAQAMRTTYTMRNRATMVLESVVPVSNGERFTFMLFNLAVAFPVTMVLSSIVAMAIVVPFNYSDIPFMTALDYMMQSFCLQWPIYVLVQLLASASLLINLLARRSLLMSYVVAFVAVVLLLWGLVEILAASPLPFNPVRDTEYIAEVAMTLYCLVPVILYALCYVALRRRQMKW